MNRLRLHHGFTLVELLIGIAILAILLALAAPSFTNVSLPSKLRAVSNCRARQTRSEAISAMPAAAPVSAMAHLRNGTEPGWIVVSGAIVLHSEPAACRLRHPVGGAAADPQPTGLARRCSPLPRESNSSRRNGRSSARSDGPAVTR
jgi:type IV fimbrial biogenesis protein FimT